jgi:HemY protein
VLLTQAEFQLDGRQYEQALATLKQIDENSANHGYALALLGRVYFKLGDWKTLSDLLPRIRKHGRVDDATLEKWTLAVHSETLRSAADEDAVVASFAAVPKTMMQHADILDAYFGALIRVGAHERAEKALEKAIARDWRGFLVRLYGLVEGSDPTRQLKVAEGWLRKHPDDADLLLTAARLCLRNELWGKARNYLETVVDLKPSPEAYRAYGRLLQQMGETDAAADAFRDGLGLVSSEPLPAIPHLKPEGE